MKLSTNDRVSIYNAAEEDAVEIPYNAACFPAGEPHIQIDEKYIVDQPVWVDARLCTAFGFMHLLTLLDAIIGCHPLKLGLFLPYFPAGRQDRRQPGTAFTLEVYASALRNVHLHYILGFDPHSETVHTKYCETIDPYDVFIGSMIKKSDYVGMICPDSGAVVRTRNFAERFGIHNIVFCSKTRNAQTGKLSDFDVPSPPVAGRYLLFDDICDGGGTFIAESALFRKSEIGQQCSIDLCVSHAIFSKGIDVVSQAFDKIITTDSFPFKEITDPKLSCASLFWHAASYMRRNLR